MALRFLSKTIAGALCLGGAWCVPAVAMVGPTSSVGSTSDLVMVLHRLGGTAGFCTAIVLRQDVVLTAAHCVPKGADLRVHLPGDPEKPVMLPVMSVTRHPEYRPDAIKSRKRSIDLALVRLARPLPDGFHPAVLARPVSAKLGARFVAEGYGVAMEGNASSSGTLRSARLVVRAPLSAVLLWAEDPANAGAGACTGDSGGPVRSEGVSEISAAILWSAGEGGQQCGQLTQAIWLYPQAAWVARVMQAWPTPN